MEAKKCFGSVALIFIDGIGVGEPDPAKNPFFSYPFKLFKDIFDQAPHAGNVPLSSDTGVLFPVDASHGFPGYPQSGTGQLSIFGGFDAIKEFGGHFGPYAPLSLTERIYNSNLFKDAIDNGYSFRFLNAYPRPFFNYLRKKPRRLNVTAHCMISSGSAFNQARHVHKKQALTAEITNYRWKQKLGSKVPEITPEEAARIFRRNMKKADLSVFEYYLTDYAGHRRYDGHVHEICDILDRFLSHLVTHFDNGTDTLLICSDHGNFEDISIKTHTLNPSMFMAFGKYAPDAIREIKDLTHIKDFIFNMLQKDEKTQA